MLNLEPYPGTEFTSRVHRVLRQEFDKQLLILNIICHR